ncbi:MAG: hypothetical protein ACI9C4_002011 [Paraglaciecola sp.]
MLRHQQYFPGSVSPIIKNNLYLNGSDKTGIFDTQKAIAMAENRTELSKAIRLDCE